MSNAKFMIAGKDVDSYKPPRPETVNRSEQFLFLLQVGVIALYALFTEYADGVFPGTAASKNYKMYTNLYGTF